MKARTIVAAVAVGGVVGLGALAAVPAFAADPPDGAGPGQGPGMGPGAGMGPGPGMGPGAGRGQMAREGANCPGGLTITEPAGTLTDAQRATLATNAEEEKLAHDLYTEFAARYDAPIFDRIAAAETAHLQAVRTLLTRYEVADPTADRAPGSFADQGMQTTYNDLLAKGGVSEKAAFEAGRTVETTDIAMLRGALEEATTPDLQRVYQHLIHASERHLAAYENALAR